MIIEELIQELQKLDTKKEIYLQTNLEMYEPNIQEMSFDDDEYYLLTI